MRPSRRSGFNEGWYRPWDEENRAAQSMKLKIFIYEDLRRFSALTEHKIKRCKNVH